MDGHIIGELIWGSILVALVLYAIYLRLDNKHLRREAHDLHRKINLLEGNVTHFGKLYSDVRIKEARQELEKKTRA
jgi:hypothetical protein